MALQCDHPEKPDLKVERWDKAMAIYILKQSEAIDICKKIINPNESE